MIIFRGKTPRSSTQRNSFQEIKRYNYLIRLKYIALMWKTKEKKIKERKIFVCVRNTSDVYSYELDSKQSLDLFFGLEICLTECTTKHPHYRKHIKYTTKDNILIILNALKFTQNLHISLIFNNIILQEK